MINAMVVDDEKLARKGFIAMADWPAYNIRFVGEAKDGQSALDILGKHAIDLIFVDISMPGMSGFELMEQVRIKYPHVKSVVLTCYHEFDYVQEALRLGAIDYIVKTLLNRNNVEETIARIMKRVSWEAKDAGALQTERKNSDAIESVQSCLFEMKWTLYSKEWKRLTGLIEETRPKPDELLAMADRLYADWLVYFGWQPEAREQWAPESPLRSLREMKDWLSGLASEVQRRMLELSLSREVVICLLQAMIYMKRHACTDLNQNVVAREVGMSRSYFSQCYKKFTDVSFGDTLRKMRIEHAKELLLHTGLSIYEIAGRIGFEDDKYFSRVFRERTGFYPTEFRSGRDTKE
ncbi:response regulator [Paenibacillaceae bacterium WGS1546]|uniref:response regulator transcription factor n=1 Tax=Cohnella sp. WGS1546 TaxID=3366810 RepID=UPI00372D0146